MITIRAYLIVITALLATTGTAFAGKDRPGKFDYYTLALSWSPSFCIDTRNRNNRQCRPERQYAFIVHGLWPQYNRGWPKNCSGQKRWLDQRHISSIIDIMPSRHLIIHEWKKHGLCSGLTAEKYFALTRQLFTKVKIPARYLSPTNTISISPRRLIEDFIATNRGLRKDMLSVQCGNSRNSARLSELRICFSKSGEFTACGANEQRKCRAKTLNLPPVR